MNLCIRKDSNRNYLFVEINKTGRKAGSLISIYYFNIYKPLINAILTLEERTTGQARYTVKDDKLNQKILKLLSDQKLNYQEWRDLSISFTNCNYKDLAQDIKSIMRIKRLLKLNLKSEVNL